MRAALIHDWLLSPIGGSEQVLEQLHTLFESPPIYTLLWNKKAFKNSRFSTSVIHPSFLQRFPFKKKWRFYLPFFPMAIEQFDLRDYDLILSSSHCVAKGILTHPDQLHICYCHTPMRYAWDLSFDYLKNLGWPSRLLMHYLRGWDVSSTHRVDHFIANSHFVRKRIRRVYGRDAEVIYPPVDTSYFQLQIKKQDFYLAAGRLVSYKRIDLIVEAFAQMPHRKLVVVGNGPEMNSLQKKASSNVEFLGEQPIALLRKLLQDAKALLFAALEDFGILPVEAMASGTPVIAFHGGGALETVLDQKTGLFFPKQSVAAIFEAISRFEQIDSWNPELIRAHALQFSKERFHQEMSSFVNTAYKKWKTQP